MSNFDILTAIQLDRTWPPSPRTVLARTSLLLLLARTWELSAFRSRGNFHPIKNCRGETLKTLVASRSWPRVVSPILSARQFSVTVRLGYALSFPNLKTGALAIAKWDRTSILPTL
jgi:hypothetical protein